MPANLGPPGFVVCEAASRRLIKIRVFYPTPLLAYFCCSITSLAVSDLFEVHKDPANGQTLLEFAGGLDHLTTRDDRQESLYENADDRIAFLKACGNSMAFIPQQKTRWYLRVGHVAGDGNQENAAAES